MKKTLAMLLAVLMLFSLLPVQTFADETAPTEAVATATEATEVTIEEPPAETTAETVAEEATEVTEEIAEETMEVTEEIAEETTEATEEAVTDETTEDTEEAVAEETVEATEAAEDVIVMETVEVSDEAANAISYSTYDAKVQEFINDDRWKNGISWGDVRPKLSTWDSLQCCAYVHDFAAYVYGCYGSFYPEDCADFDVLYSADQIRTGDIIHYNRTNDYWGHWFVVLKRNGNKLYVAEGNVDGKVRISDNIRYIEDGKLKNASNSNWENNLVAMEIYHYNKFIDDLEAVAYKNQ